MNKIKLIVLLPLFLSISLSSYAQLKNDLEAGIFNIGIAGAVGGIGAMINKNPEEKVWKVLLKGAGQGALGGYLVFESKRLIGKFASTGNYAYVWPSKLINTTGASIIENAAANRDLWHKWHINIGFSRMEINFKDNYRISHRIMPFALGGFVYGISKGDFNLEKTLKSGNLVFIADNLDRGNLKPIGLLAVNTILIKKNSGYNEEQILAHETLHVYQYESYSGFNSYLEKPMQKLVEKKSWAGFYDKFFYSDFNYLISHWEFLFKDIEFIEKEVIFYTGEFSRQK